MFPKGAWRFFRINNESFTELGNDGTPLTDCMKGMAVVPREVSGPIPRLPAIGKGSVEGWILRRRKLPFQTLKESKYSTILKNRYFGERSQKRTYFIDLDYQEISKSALFVENRRLKFLNSFDFCPVLPETEKLNPEKCAIRCY